ncbi:MAG: hypothetical protein Q4G04_00020 [bacterium]|nr:hypothetical protein [bacterium]
METINNLSKEKEEKRKKLFFVILAFATLLMIILGATFAWFSVTTSSDTSNIVTSGSMQILYNNGSVIGGKNIKPATFNQVKSSLLTQRPCIFEGDISTNEPICTINDFTITNTGTLNAYITVDIIDTTETTINKYNLYSCNDSSSPIYNATECQALNITNMPVAFSNNSLKYAIVTDLNNLNNNDFKLYNGQFDTSTVGGVLPIESDMTYYIIMYLPETVENSEQGKTFTASINIRAEQTNK